jgi:hypothetical protein
MTFKNPLEAFAHEILQLCFHRRTEQLHISYTGSPSQLYKTIADIVCL